MDFSHDFREWDPFSSELLGLFETQILIKELGLWRERAAEGMNLFHCLRIRISGSI